MAQDDSFPDFYYTTQFRGDPIPAHVEPFAIITAYPTTGETWTQQQIVQADRNLHRDLENANALLGRMTGYDPDGNHSEPGWAAQLDFDAACDLGAAYRQTALYYVQAGILHLSFCDERRKLVEVDGFQERFTPNPARA